MSRNTPLITTVIPTYRRPRLLRRAIRSVLSQTYPRFEVLVCDNASGDETAAMCAEMATRDPRLTYLCRSKNIGALNNFKSGIEAIKTPFFSILSDDDVLLPDFYKTALGGFDKYPNAVFAATRVIGMDSLGRAYPMFEITSKPAYYEPPQGLRDMLRHGHPTWTGILFKKEIYDTLNGLDLETGAAADLDFELRIAAHHPFVAIDKICAIFTTHEASLTTSARLNSIWPCWLKMINNLSHDPSLSAEARDFADKILSARLENRVIASTVRSIVRNNFGDAYSAAHVVRDHFKRPMISSCLNVLVAVTEKYSGVLRCIQIVNALRKKFRRRNSGLPADLVQEYSKSLLMQE